MPFKKEFFINEKKISESSLPFLVAEIGLNHNNDYEIGKKTIIAAKKAGADAVKFQSYITEEFIDKNNPEAKFLFDIFKKYELSKELHLEFKRIAETEGIIFFSTPLCNSSVDLLNQMEVPAFKIASGDIVNKPLLEKVASTKKPIFLSTGAADFSEVTRAVEYLEKLRVEELCLMHCVSMYPTPPAKLNLKKIELYQSMYNFPIGFSDHSAGHLGSSIAVGMGACIIEKHFTLDKNLPGPDHSISLDPSEWKILSDSIDLAFQMKGVKKLNPQEEEINGRFFGRRSSYFYDKKWITLRPAVHLKDESVLDSWKTEAKDKISETSEEGPIKFNTLKLS